VTFEDETAFTKAQSLVKKWQAEADSDYGFYWFTTPACFLSLRMSNLEKGGGSSVPYFDDKNPWGAFGKTAAGNIRIDE
jgi:hypothetical protein